MNAIDIAGKSLAVAYGIKRLMNVEVKFFDVSGVAVAIPDGVGTIVQLTNIPQGDTDITRDGAQVKLMSIDFKAFINMSASATASTVTIMLIVDKQTNQAIYTTTALLHTVTNALSVVSPLNLDNKFRFRVLKRWIFDINNDGRNKKVLKWHHKFGNNMKIRFDNSTSAIEDLTSKSLSLLFISTEGTNEPTIHFFNRLRFVDN